jgi:hypothetical protein
MISFYFHYDILPRASPCKAGGAITGSGQTAYCGLRQYPCHPGVDTPPGLEIESRARQLRLLDPCYIETAYCFLLGYSKTSPPSVTIAACRSAMAGLSRGWQLVLGLLLVVHHYTRAAPSCPLTYNRKSTDRAMLLGGIYDASCTGCTQRGDFWSDRCQFNASSDTWGVCTEEQRQNNLPFLRNAANGGIVSLKPCELWSYLRGRTLWLMG